MGAKEVTQGRKKSHSLTDEAHSKGPRKKCSLLRGWNPPTTVRKHEKLPTKNETLLKERKKAARSKSN